MGYENCDGWEYSAHPNVQSVRDACMLFLEELRRSPAAKTAALSDTRSFHATMFSGVAPSACPYLAGNYRGADYECLRAYQVFFGNHQGTLAVGVAACMEFYHSDLLAAFDELDSAAVAAEKPLIGTAFLVRLVQILAAALVSFFTIHPFANGNGHMGRLVGRYGRLPARWWLHESPPAYGPLLTAHRNGKPKGLEKYLLQCIIG
jgi:Fic/DOC family